VVFDRKTESETFEGLRETRNKINYDAKKLTLKEMDLALKNMNVLLATFSPSPASVPSPESRH